MIKLTMIKRFLIFIASFIVFLYGASTSFASTLTLTPASTNIPQGSIVSVQVRLNAQGESINGVSAYISYPQDKLDVSSITYGSSVFGIAAESYYGGGSIRISRGSITGATGNVNVATINFKGKSQGTATVSFINGSGAPRTSNSTDSLNLPGSTGGTYTIGPAAPKDLQSQELAIKDVLVSSISTNNATITWTTDVKSDSTVEYGLQQGKYILSSYDKKGVLEHKITIGENLIPGETIYFRVKSEAAIGEGVSKDLNFQLLGYTVKVTILDIKGNPIPNAEVILYSSPVRQTTDQQGVATFTNVTPTRHLVVVKSEGIETSKEIDVKEDSLGEFTLTVNAKSNDNTLLTIFYASLAIIIFVIAIVIIILKRKSNSATNLPTGSL